MANPFKMSDEDLNKQIFEYDFLKIYQSYRWISVLLILGSGLISLVLAYYKVIPMQDVIITFIIYFFIAIFIYRGHRWAMILMIILWTLEKGAQIYQMIETHAQGNVISPILFWLAFVSYFYKALVVENEKKGMNP